MNLNRRRSGTSDAWGRVFVLLIVLFVGLYFTDRFIGLDGIFQRIGATQTIQPSVTATATPVVYDSNEYVFVDPTQIPSTATVQPTPTLTPTPYLPIELAQINDGIAVERSAPWTIIGYCTEPYKTSRYVSYDLISRSFRSLSGSVPYLAEPEDQISLALRDGILQNNLPVNFLDAFAIPSEWLADKQYAVLGISWEQDAVVIHRWASETEGIYWFSRGSESFIKLLDLPNSFEESYTDPNDEWLLLRMINANGISDLYAVDLTVGSLVLLTEFQTLDAFGGVLSADGTRVAYWTEEGIWVINLDGSFGALIFPGASHPYWSPLGDQMVMINAGEVVIGELNFGIIADANLVHLPAVGQQPVWTPDGSTIVYWEQKNQDCTLNFWDIEGAFSVEVFRTQNQICQSDEPVRWSPDGAYLLTSLPSTGVGDEASGDILCHLANGTCEYLRFIRGNYPCREGQWSTYTFPYQWTFDEGLEDWYLVQQLSNVRIFNGNIVTRSFGMTPLISTPPNLNINADIYPFIEITMQVSGGTWAEMNFVTVSSPVIEPNKAFRFDIIPDGEMHRYVIDLREFSPWDGVIKYLRLRPTNEALVDIQIQSVRILSRVEELQ